MYMNVSVGVYRGEIWQKAASTGWFWDMLCSLCTSDNSASFPGIQYNTFCTFVNAIKSYK